MRTEPMATKSGRFESQAMNALKKCLLSHPTGIDSGGYPQIVHSSNPSRCMSEWLLKPIVFMGFPAVVDSAGTPKRSGGED